MESNYLEHIQFEGATWKALKHHLEVKRNNKLGLLLRSATWDDANKVKGAIAVLDELLALDKPTATTAVR